MNPTRWVLVAIGAVALVWEGIALEWSPTVISHEMRRNAACWWTIPWGWGVLATHFFGPPGTVGRRWIALAVVGGAVLARDLVARLHPLPDPEAVPRLALGLVCGLLFWPQH